MAASGWMCALLCVPRNEAADPRLLPLPPAARAAPATSCASRRCTMTCPGGKGLGGCRAVTWARHCPCFLLSSAQCTRLTASTPALQVRLLQRQLPLLRPVRRAEQPGVLPGTGGEQGGLSPGQLSVAPEAGVQLLRTPPWQRAACPAVAALPALLQHLPCCPAALLPCGPAALLPCCPAALLPCCPAALLPCCPAALLPCCPAALLLRPHRLRPPPWACRPSAASLRAWPRRAG
jgi:hypothetical protein